jgi:DNA helicase-2/ATP-dependent DNA helicase PcrA
VKDILADLNPAQLESVTAPDGPILVVAGAGSGKTRVLTTRVAWLLEQEKARPSEVLAFTFTNRAAREMRERVGQTVGEERAPFWIGTFHATGLKILRNDGEALGVKRGFSIFDTDDTQKLLKQVLADLNIDPKKFTPQAVRSRISSWKNDDVDPARAAQKAGQKSGNFVDQKYAEIYQAYEEALGKCNALDFDDLILKTVHLLEQDEEVRAKYSQKFRYVMVDEFQDTNPLQLLLVKLLSSWHGNVFAVGDDDQSIYSWRGARVENMLQFDEFFPGAVTFRLEQNYRSTGNILSAANEVIAHNKQRKGKNLWTAGGEGDKLTEEEFLDDEDEAARLVDIVRTETAGGTARGDITVLYRTNAQSRVLEDALRRAHLPYQIVGGLHFYDRKEVRDLLAYLKFTANPADRISALRIINVPKRKIGNTTVERLHRLADRENLTLGEAAASPGLLEQEIAPAACQRVRDFFQQAVRWRVRAAEGEPVHELVMGIIKDIGYDQYLQADDPDSAGSRSENINELINAAGSFHESSDGGTLDQFLEQVALVSDPDTIQEDEGVVRLMTIHTAKGLEFPVVVIVGCEDDILPHMNSHLEESTLEEERRLFYVALTRAEKRIYLTHATRRRRFGTYQDSLPSRFLPELPDDLVERRHLDRPQARPVSSSLFGDDFGGRSRGPASSSGRKVGRSTWSPKSGTAGSGRRNPPSSSVRPDQWGSSNKPRQSAQPSANWDSEISQDAGFYAGQTVSHGKFGLGKVVRVEGGGGDVQITVDFFDGKRRHINPRFAPLVAVD